MQMGLLLSLKVGDRFVMLLEDGRKIEIARVKYNSFRGGTYLDIKAPKTVKILREKVEEPTIQTASAVEWARESN